VKRSGRAMAALSDLQTFEPGFVAGTPFHDAHRPCRAPAAAENLAEPQAQLLLLMLHGQALDFGDPYNAGAARDVAPTGLGAWTGLRLRSAVAPTFEGESDVAWAVTRGSGKAIREHVGSPRRISSIEEVEHGQVGLAEGGLAEQLPRTPC